MQAFLAFCLFPSGALEKRTPMRSTKSKTVCTGSQPVNGRRGEIDCKWKMSEMDEFPRGD